MTDTGDARAMLQEKMGRLRAEIGRAFIGHEEIVKNLVIALLAGGHVLLEGVPGLGKTLLVRAMSKAFGGTFSRIQFTPDLMPSDVSGHAIYNTQSETFRVRRGPVFANLLLADEINRAPAKTQASLLEAMQENQVTVEGKTLPLPTPFMTVATQNPVEHEGTYPLPEAQLDRFLFKVLIDYPAHDVEVRIVTSITHDKVGETLDVEDVNEVMTGGDVIEAQKLVAQTQVEPAVIDYAVRIVAETRKASGIRMGAGPRGPISIVRAARALAMLEQRSYVTPDDVRAVVLPTLRHRIALAPELEIEAYRPDDILRDILGKVAAPRE